MWGCSVKGYWAPRDATRSFAILIMTLGSTWSTMVAAWLTPPLAGWAGWRAVPYVFGSTIMGMSLLWQICGAERPGAEAEAQQKERPKYDPRIVLVRPAIAMIASQTAGMSISNGGGASILGAWAPTYYTEHLGVPLERIGLYLSAPMVVAFFGKIFVSFYEFWLRKRGVTLLNIRKLSTLIAAIGQSGGMLCFALSPTPLLATLSYIVVQMGASFNTSGFSSNYLDLGGDETATFTSLANTSAWAATWLVSVRAPLAQPWLAAFQLRVC